ncbi:adenylate/guanylate cyclase domain-containing protein [Mycolicibacterium diernhoferi]|uniref:Adenylate cyclase n=1 Tax=Mycolicibacterium diernhoferi TaxID=1801 RepID=A0A1Q4HMP9_9MYCO|nr:adenylate/guanylate cyclase domain-containing protein [Mycolicibacterium diernhoferi]OPE46573.1 adenylate/guanylate cyclase domain-containing protein [Mycolicibacterium diernhoferi]PEG52005.1 adenylate/guanylate cyclase domain-containing protein [Mycolicibacterium diernhoferi]QYL20846.1 adenylate/guanylate cyclase domain-containing protein [Mycolicibacterium diernhoferi]
MVAVTGPRGCLPDLPEGRRDYEDAASRRRATLTISTRIAATIVAAYGVVEMILIPQATHIWLVNLATAAVFIAIPLLYRFGPLVAATVFVTLAYAFTAYACSQLGTDTGLQFYFFVGAALIILVIGGDHLAIASVLAASGAGLAIALEWLVVPNTGIFSESRMQVSFAVTVAAASLMMLIVVGSAMRRIDRAENALRLEFAKSEALLANILPDSIATRLKDRDDAIIADGYEDASILFADIAGYTKRASDTDPAELVLFLNRLFTDFDALVDRHGLEKIKTSGDSYMVVSGVPQPRPDHLESLACLALDMAAAVDGLRDQQGREVPLRIGIAAGPVVAGVVGSRKFFYDVWGDAVNVASRMESTDVEGRIQVPQDVYDRINASYVFEERGEVEVKGKGAMHTWYLVGRRPAPGNGERVSDPAALRDGVSPGPGHTL